MGTQSTWVTSGRRVWLKGEKLRESKVRK